MTDDTTDLAVAPEAPSGLHLFPADPKAMVQDASARATALAEIIEGQQLYTMIRGRKHVTVSGWTTLGAMVGVFPVVAWVRPTPDHQAPVFEFYRDGSRNKRRTLERGYGGWEARVEARTLDGAVVGAAESECRYDETTWSTRDSYALKSMAQTRATSKALRLPLGFIIDLAGFDPTPEEEMPGSAHPKISLERLPEGMDPIIWTKQVAGTLAKGEADIAKEWWEDACRMNDIDPYDKAFTEGATFEVAAAEGVAEAIRGMAAHADAFEAGSDDVVEAEVVEEQPTLISGEYS